MRKLFKERKLFKGGNYMRKYGIYRCRNDYIILIYSHTVYLGLLLLRPIR